MGMKTEVIENKRKKQSEKIYRFLDYNVSLSDLNTGPIEFTEKWTQIIERKGSYDNLLSTDVLHYYVDKTTMTTL
jgi:hypothetical protein